MTRYRYRDVTVDEQTQAELNRLRTVRERLNRLLALAAGEPREVDRPPFDGTYKLSLVLEPEKVILIGRRDRKYRIVEIFMKNG